jgi:predicted glutamine amidotransferase
MCRLFGVLSNAPVDAARYLLHAPHSLFTQSFIDKKRKQKDGWGVGWIESGHPEILKSARPMVKDRAQVEEAARLATGHVVLGHVRWASNPLKLSRKELLGVHHSQPFAHGPLLFVHNGTLYIPNEVRAELGPWERYIRGRNDSEVLFYWLMKTVIRETGPWAQRVRNSVKGLDRIWKKHAARYRLYKHPYHGLNWVLTNGKLLLAFCYVDPGGFSKAKAFGNKKQPYYQMQIERHENGVVVASEPLTLGADWKPMEHGQLLIAERQKNKVSVETLAVL